MAFPQFEVLNETVEMDIARTITGAANGIHLTVTDTSTSGDVTGIKVNYNGSGARTSGWLAPIGVSLALTDDTAGNVSPLSVDFSITSGKNLGWFTGLWMYLGDIGTGTVKTFSCIDIERVIANNASAVDTFVKMVVHGTGKAGSCFYLDGSPYIADYLFEFGHGATPFSGHAASGSIVGSIAIRADSTPYYLPVYAAVTT